MASVSYVGFVASFGVQLVLVRLIAPEDFGLFALGLSIANMVFLLFNFTFSMGVIQIQEAEDLFDTAFYLSLISSFIIILIGGIVSPILFSYYPAQAVMVFLTVCVLQGIQGCASIYSASLEKELQFKKNAIVRGIASNISGIAAIIMAYVGLGVWSLVGREMLRAIIMLIGMRSISRYRFKGRFSKNTAKLLLGFAYRRVFIRGLENAYTNGPIFLLGNLVTLQELGFFTQARYLACLPNTVLTPIHQTVAFPVYSKLKADRQKLQKAFDANYFFYLRFLIPISLIIYLFPEQILTFLYGEQWIGSAPVLRSLSPYITFYALVSSIVMLLYALRIEDIIKVQGLHIITFTLVFFLFTGMLESKIVLVAVAYSISILVGFLSGLYFLKNLGIRIGFRSQFLKPFSVGLGIVILWQLFIAPHIDLSNLANSSMLIIIAGTSILSLLLLFLSEYKRSLYFFRYVSGYMKKND